LFGVNVRNAVQLDGWGPIWKSSFRKTFATKKLCNQHRTISATSSGPKVPHKTSSVVSDDAWKLATDFCEKHDGGCHCCLHIKTIDKYSSALYIIITLQPRYNAHRLSAQSVITLIARWIPLNNDGVILQSPNILLTLRVLRQHKLCFINRWIFSSYNTIACCFWTGVIYDCPTWSTSPLLCNVCHSESAFHYNAHL